ncbi:uncharacterized protein METZ01_LOCUS515574 [marine metagenome]|uniref:Uncharacterized protein n=1 Tax=marine metagenome TaxID=408172 RepID=A0A383F2F6_9ZZZZ
MPIVVETLFSLGLTISEAHAWSCQVIAWQVDDMITCGNYDRHRTLCRCIRGAKVTK